ncbi:MAG TPA: hypothetical protein DIT77_10650 [Marinobacter hydrocarbonoclasticus]|nr:hypothetical protein [Marinobacter nauticus]
MFTLYAQSHCQTGSGCLSSTQSRCGRRMAGGYP